MKPYLQLHHVLEATPKSEFAPEKSTNPRQKENERKQVTELQVQLKEKRAHRRKKQEPAVLEPSTAAADIQVH